MREEETGRLAFSSWQPRNQGLDANSTSTIRPHYAPHPQLFKASPRPVGDETGKGPGVYFNPCRREGGQVTFFREDVNQSLWFDCLFVMPAGGETA